MEGAFVKCSGGSGVGDMSRMLLQKLIVLIAIQVLGTLGSRQFLIVKGVHPPWAVQRVRLGGQASTIQGVIQLQECSQTSLRAAPV